MRNLSGRLFFWVSIVATVVSMNFWAISMLVTEVTPLFIALTVINGVCLIVTVICMSLDIYKNKKRKEQRAAAENVDGAETEPEPEPEPNTDAAELEPRQRQRQQSLRRR